MSLPYLVGVQIHSFHSNRQRPQDQHRTVTNFAETCSRSACNSNSDSQQQQKPDKYRVFISHRLFVCCFLEKEIYTETCAYILRCPVLISILFHLFLILFENSRSQPCFGLFFFFFLMQQAFIAKEQKIPVVCLQCWDHTHVDGNTIWSPSSNKDIIT